MSKFPQPTSSFRFSNYTFQPSPRLPSQASPFRSGQSFPSSNSRSRQQKGERRSTRELPSNLVSTGPSRIREDRERQSGRHMISASYTPRSFSGLARPSASSARTRTFGSAVSRNSRIADQQKIKGKSMISQGSAPRPPRDPSEKDGPPFYSDEEDDNESFGTEREVEALPSPVIAEQKKEPWQLKLSDCIWRWACEGENPESIPVPELKKRLRIFGMEPKVAEKCTDVMVIEGQNMKTKVSSKKRFSRVEDGHPNIAESGDGKTIYREYISAFLQWCGISDNMADLLPPHDPSQNPKPGEEDPIYSDKHKPEGGALVREVDKLRGKDAPLLLGRELGLIALMFLSGARLRHIRLRENRVKITGESKKKVEGMNPIWEQMFGLYREMDRIQTELKEKRKNLITLQTGHTKAVSGNLVFEARQHVVADLLKLRHLRDEAREMEELLIEKYEHTPKPYEYRQKNTSGKHENVPALPSPRGGAPNARKRVIPARKNGDESAHRVIQMLAKTIQPSTLMLTRGLAAPSIPGVRPAFSGGSSSGPRNKTPTRLNKNPTVNVSSEKLKKSLSNEKKVYSMEDFHKKNILNPAKDLGGKGQAGKPTFLPHKKVNNPK